MKVRNTATLLLMIVGLSLFAQVDRTKIPEPATPRPIEIGDFESFELKNGLKVFVIENHKLPRVSFSLSFDRDPILEGDKAGYLGMFGQMLRTGTSNRTKEQIDDEVDFIGASLSGSSSSLYVSGLSKYLRTLLDLMTDVLYNSTFPEEELEKIRTQTLSGLASGKDDPSTISSNLNSIMNYGDMHPYGELQTEETTNNITIEDLKAYYDKYFVPNIAYLAIVGDVNPKKIKKMIQSHFGKWERGQIQPISYETPKAPEKTRVNLVNRSNSVQSVINISYPVKLAIVDKDVIPVKVMNTILGSGFSSKLNMNLREDKGYTYGARSSLFTDDLISKFSAGANVRNEVTDSSIVQILKEMIEMIDGNITSEELNLAKNSIAGSFSRSLEQPQTVARFAVNAVKYSLPDQYYSTYVQRVQAVTIEDVKAMALKYITPENAHINVVGKASEIADNLAQFGELKYFDLDGKEVDPALAKLPDGLTTEKVLNDFIKAIGGKQTLREVSNFKITMEASIMGQKAQIEVTKAAPNKSFSEVKIAGNTVQKEVFNGTTGSKSGMAGKMGITGEEAEDKKIESYLFEEIAYLEGKAETKLIGIETIDNEDTYGLEVKLPSGKISTRYYSVDSGLLKRVSLQVDGPQGVVMMSTDFKEYMEYEGIKVPSFIKQPMSPSISMELKTTAVEINTELPEDLFDE